MVVLRRITSAALILGLAVATLSPGTASAVPSTEVIACTAGGPRPCIESVTRAGAPLPAGYAVHATTFTIEGARYLTFGVSKDASLDLGAAELAVEWRFAFDLGDLVPRVVTGKGQSVTVSRTKGSAGHGVVITLRPVTTSGQCDQSSTPWTCPEYAADPQQTNKDRAATIAAEITDYGVWEDVEQRNAMYGLDYFSNVAATSSPPDIVRDTATGENLLRIEMANRHFLEDGTTVFQGQAELRIPNRFLRVAYGVPNPELMSSSSLAVGGASGAAVSITQESGADAMRVAISGLTFSHRVVKVRRGTIKPARPTDVHAKRVTGTRGKVVFDRAQARGAKVTGYEARCVARGSVVTAKARKSPVVVRGLVPGKKYSCRVRAFSKAGAGKYSRADRL